MQIDVAYLMEVLREMIAIDSVLPHEARLAEYLAARIAALGLIPEIMPVSPGRPNVCALADFGGSDRFLVYSGHSDTVPPAKDWVSDPFTPLERDGRLYGLGASNMKGGLACMLAAFKALVADGNLSGRLGLAVTVDQEGCSSGARALLGTRYGTCDAMLHAEHFFGDSAEDYLPRAGTGKILYEVAVQGRAGHALRPAEGGVNAIDAGARIVTALGRLPLGRGTLCTLKITGGYQEYSLVVPEACTIVITRLIVPGETRQTAIAELRRLVADLALDAKVTISTPPPYYDPYALAMDLPFVDIFGQAYRDALGSAPCFAEHRGITDANVFVAEGGIPTILFGPKGDLHHRAGEYVEMASLEPVGRIYAETARRYLTAERSTP